MWIRDIFNLFCNQSNMWAKTKRPFIPWLTRSSKNVSTSVLLVISNILPIDLKIFEISASRFLIAKYNDFFPSFVKTIESVVATCNLSAYVHNDRRFHSKMQPPLVQQQLCFTTTIDDFPLQPSAADRVIIYTLCYKKNLGGTGKI